MDNHISLTGPAIAAKLLQLEKLWNKQPQLKVKLHGDIWFEGKLDPQTVADDLAEVRAGFHSASWRKTQIFTAAKDSGPSKQNQIVSLIIVD